MPGSGKLRSRRLTAQRYRYILEAEMLSYFQYISTEYGEAPRGPQPCLNPRSNTIRKIECDIVYIPKVIVAGDFNHHEATLSLYEQGDQNIVEWMTTFNLTSPPTRYEHLSANAFIRPQSILS
ncbi:hypothetical protein FQN57_002697 [Myotisia sp. PD_48]|nr:hypothetical protein FQN57_002697 [Myotisia sp. PD_48]